MVLLSNTNAELAVVFGNREGPYSWYGVTVRDFTGQLGAWFPVYLSCFVPPATQRGDVVSVFLANRESPSMSATSSFSG